MNEREWLIELLRKVQDYGTKHTSEEWSVTVECKDNENIADHLIANGVTVREWIPVTERLPTNGDRIRAMSDEELAELFWSIIHERELLIIEKLNEQGIEASLFEAPNASVNAHMEWLKQPAKEEV